MHQSMLIHAPLSGSVLLVISMLISGCSTVSDMASSSASMLSDMNPFGARSSATEEQSVPAAEVVPVSAPPATIQVENTSPSYFRRVSNVEPPPVDVDATVGNNKQCTTFCALPLRKPQ